MLPTGQQVPGGGLDIRTDHAGEDPREGTTETWVLFTVEEQVYALDLWEVERIVRAVEVRPLPEVPAYVTGVIDVQGRILPVVDLRIRFDRPPKPLDPNDHFLIAQGPTHSVVLPVDMTLGSYDIPAESIPADSELPRCVRKVVPLDLGVVYSLDLQRVLFGDEPPFDTRLAQVLAELQKR